MSSLWLTEPPWPRPEGQDQGRSGRAVVGVSEEGQEPRALDTVGWCELEVRVIGDGAAHAPAPAGELDDQVNASRMAQLNRADAVVTEVPAVTLSGGQHLVFGVGGHAASLWVTSPKYFRQTGPIRRFTDLAAFRVVPHTMQAA